MRITEPRKANAMRSEVFELLIGCGEKKRQKKKVRGFFSLIHREIERERVRECCNVVNMVGVYIYVVCICWF